MWRRHCIPRLAAICAVAWMAGQLLPASSMAQTGSGDRVGDVLRQTDRALERAHRIVGESDSQRARDLVEMALRIQMQAWEQYNARHSSAAAKLAGEARVLGARAVGLAREDMTMRNRAREEGEKASRALSRAREQAGGAADGQVQRLLEQAASLIERGRVKFGEQRFQAALRLAVSAQQLVRQAMGLMGDGPGDGLSRVRRELERTDHLIDRAGSIVEESGNRDAARMFDHGKDLQARAWNAFRTDRPRAAAASTREARNAINRARALAQGPIDPDAVERALAETDRLLGHAGDLVGESGDEMAVGILDRAQAHQDRAQEFLADEQLRKALAETRVARSLAKRAIRVAEQGNSR